MCVEKEYCPVEVLADEPDKNVFYCPEQMSKGAACCNGCECLCKIRFFKSSSLRNQEKKN
jgi:hypothetical protein